MMLKKYSVIAVIFLSLFAVNSTAEELFPDTLPAKKTTASKKKRGAKRHVKPTKKRSWKVLSENYNVSLNTEAVIMRGDIQMLYEPIPSKRLWSWVFMGHVNPQTAQDHKTGKWGAFAGARWYINVPQQGPFMQLLGGLNMTEEDELVGGVLVSGGYRRSWSNSFFWEAGLTADRSYKKGEKDPNLFLFLNLGRRF